MTEGEWAGLALGAAGLIGGWIGSLLRLRDKLVEKISTNSKALHEKIEEVKRDYVRRDDIRDDIQRLERGQENMTAKVDQMVTALVPAITRMTEVIVNRNQH